MHENEKNNCCQFGINNALYGFCSDYDVDDYRDIETTSQHSITPLFMVVTIAVFLWGVVQFIFAAGDEEKIKSAKGYIVYGLVGVFVMVSFWGIIQVFGATFGFQPGQGTITAPTIGF